MPDVILVPFRGCGQAKRISFSEELVLVEFVVCDVTSTTLVVLTIVHNVRARDCPLQ